MATFCSGDCALRLADTRTRLFDNLAETCRGAAILSPSLAHPRIEPISLSYEDRLSRQLLTLPCDHRYGVEELARLADSILRLVPQLYECKVKI